MMQITDPVFRKLETISNQVKQQFKKKGLVIPLENNDGSISVGHYRILKKNSFYQIVNNYEEVIFDQINLPQTAILTANSLALGKIVDQTIIITDKLYGFADFEQTLFRKRIQKNNKKQIDEYVLKERAKKQKKDSCRQLIVDRFEDLLKFA